MVGEWDATLEHLLFHKSLISEDGNERIDEYMQVVRSMEQGMHVISSDPVEKAIHIAFQLVQEHGFNPWNIDLCEFTKLYLKRLRKEGEVNFIIAGRLVLMAWSILRMQSTELLSAAEPPAPAEMPMWEMGDVYASPEDLDYRDAVLCSASPLISPAVRHDAPRPVTLMELIEALDEARQEVALQETIRTMREARKDVKPATISDKVHKENLQEDIKNTWGRICMFNGSPIPLRALYTTDPWDRAAVFVSVLFLAKEERIKIWQDSLPYGEIYVQNLHPEKEEAPVPKAAVEVEV
ncbi:MAG: segregation/condensation protein A [Candidatus Thermoplasmatota archaeon]